MDFYRETDVDGDGCQDSLKIIITTGNCSDNYRFNSNGCNFWLGSNCAVGVFSRTAHRARSNKIRDDTRDVLESEREENCGRSRQKPYRYHLRPKLKMTANTSD